MRASVICDTGVSHLYLMEARSAMSMTESPASMVTFTKTSLCKCCARSLDEDEWHIEGKP